MAKNLVHDEDRYIAEVAATDPATAESGDPVLVGNIPGVALVDEGDGGNGTGNITIDWGGIWNSTTTTRTARAGATRWAR